MKKTIRMLALCAMLIFAFCATALATDAPPSVMVNGEYVDFPDAVPQNVDGRIYIPLRAVFNMLGFADEDITWDPPTRTATAVKGDLTVKLTEGQKEVTVTRGSETAVLETDAAAYIDAAAGRTMVPLRFVAQAAGCNVGWDADDKTAIIDDTAAILAANTETYSLMDKYLDYSQSFAKKKQAITGNFRADLLLDADTLLINGSYDMLTDGSGAQFAADLRFSGTANGEDVSATVPCIDMDLRFDQATGVYYLKSDALNELLNLGISGVWYKMDMTSLLGADAGHADMTALSAAAQELSFSQYLELVLSSMTLNDINSTTGDTLAQLNSICADSAFKKSGATYTSSAVLDGTELSMTLYGYGSSISGYTVKIGIPDLMTMDLSMRDNRMTTRMELTSALPAGENTPAVNMTVTLTMDGTYRPTNKTPQLTPPVGAGMIDLMDLMKAEG